MRLLRKPNNHMVENKTLSFTERQKSDSGQKAGIKEATLGKTERVTVGKLGKEA